MPPFDQLMGLAGSLQREGPGDVDPQVTVIDQLGAAPQDLPLVHARTREVIEHRGQHQLEADTQVPVTRLLQIQARTRVEDGDQVAVMGHRRDRLTEDLGTYRIECRAGKGSDSSDAMNSSFANGAKMRADFNLTEGDKFYFVVGAQGGSEGSGGGASFVCTIQGNNPTNLGYLSSTTISRPLIIAGGAGLIDTNLIIIIIALHTRSSL